MADAHDRAAVDDGQAISSSAAALAAAVIDDGGGEAPRQPDDFEPLTGGSAGDHTNLRAGLAGSGGIFTFLILLVLNSLDELEAATMTVLAPDIRDAFDVSDGVIVFISSASAAFFVLGAVPMGYLADRCRRSPIVGWASLVFSATVFLSGLAVNALMLFWTRFGAGIAKANTLPVHGSLLADTYPISLRGRIAATTSMVGRTVQAISPLVVGGLAILLGWRWPFLILGIPVAIFAVLAFRIPEPTRGQWEKQSVLDEVIDDRQAAPISIEAAFARLMRINTLRTVVIGFAALGFSLFTVPVLASLYTEDEFGANAFERGVVTSVGRLRRAADPALSRSPLRRGLPARSGPAAARHRVVHHPDGGGDPASVPDAEHRACSRSSASSRAFSPSPPSAW